MTPSLTVFLIFAALITVLASAYGKVPLWVAVLLAIIIEALMVLPK